MKGKTYGFIYYYLRLTSCCEGVSTLCEDLHQVVGQVTTGQVQTEDGVGEGVTFVDWDGVGDTISGIEDNTWGEEINKLEITMAPVWNLVGYHN